MNFPSSFKAEVSFKKFHFTDELDIIELSCSSSDSLCSETEHHICSDSSCLNIEIQEFLNPDFGMYVWPSAPVLGKYIWTHREKINKKRVLELGAGTGLASVVAAKCGAFMICTDSKKFQSVFHLLESNMLLNNISHDSFETKDVTWGIFSPFLLSLNKVDVILGSDIFYNPSDFEDIIVTVSYILKKNPNAEFWFTYEHRCSDWKINYLLEKWDLDAEEIPLESFGADKFNVAGSDLPGTKSISCFVITLSQPANFS